MAQPLTKDQATAWIKRQFGCGVVGVELTKEQLEDAFDDAVRWWVGRRGIKKLAGVNLVPSINEYTLPDDCDQVIECWFPGTQLDIIAAVNPYTFIDMDQLPAAYQSIMGVPGGSFYGTWMQVVQHAETARRVIGAEVTWEYYKDTNTLRVFPMRQHSGAAIARYASNTLTADTETSDFAKKIWVRDRDLILRYAKLMAKAILGRIRGKYTDWPSAGGRVTMDGDNLLQEVQMELDLLNQEIMGMSDPVPFITG